MFLLDQFSSPPTTTWSISPEQSLFLPRGTAAPTGCRVALFIANSSSSAWWWESYGEGCGNLGRGLAALWQNQVRAGGTQIDETGVAGIYGGVHWRVQHVFWFAVRLWGCGIDHRPRSGARVRDAPAGCAFLSHGVFTIQYVVIVVVAVAVLGMRLSNLKRLPHILTLFC